MFWINVMTYLNPVKVHAETLAKNDCCGSGSKESLAGFWCSEFALKKEKHDSFARPYA